MPIDDMLVTALFLWVPSIALAYLLGLGVAWVRRGFSRNGGEA